MENEKNDEDDQVAGSFYELDRKPVNVIDGRIQCVAVYGEAEMAFDAITASAKKAPNPSEKMKQRDTHGIHVIHHVSMSEL